MAQDVKVVKTVFEVDSTQVNKASKEFDNLSKSIDKTGKELTNTGKQAEQQSQKTKSAIENSKQSVDRFGNSISGIGSMVAGAFAVGSIVSFGRAVLDATAKNETLITSFKVMLKSKEEANRLMGQLVEFAKTTPFELSDVAEASKRLMAFGVNVNDIESNLRKLGDVASGVGAPLGDIAYLFGTIKTQGRAMTVDINQFANRGIPIWEELSKITGKNGIELRKYVEEGKVGFKDIEQVFTNLTKEGGTFFNLMNEQSDTLSGKISNLSDSWSQFLVIIGEKTAPALKQAFSDISEILATITYELKYKEKVAEEMAANSTKNQVKNFLAKFEEIKEASKKGGKDFNNELNNYYKETESSLQKSISKQKEDLKTFAEDTEGMIKIGEDDLTIFGKTGDRVVAVYEKELSVQKAMEMQLKSLKQALIDYNKPKQEDVKNTEEQTKALKKLLDEKYKQFKLELDLLHAEEKRALQVSKNAKENTLKQISIEQDYNEKRIGIYTKYNAYLQKQDKSAKQDLILNTKTLGFKRYDEEIAQLKAYQDKVKAMLEKNEKDVRAKNLSESNIEQSKINIEKYNKLKDLYSNDKISFEDMIKEKDRIELEYKEKSLQANKVYLEKRLQEESLTSEEEFNIKEELAKNEVDLNEEKNKKKLEQDKKYAEDNRQITKALGQFAKEAVDTFFTYRSRVLSAELDESNRNKESELAKIEETEDGKAKVYTKAETQKKAIEEKYRIEQVNIKRQQFELQKTQALTEIAINTAVAVAKVWAQTGTAGIIAQFAPIAMGALQAGLVLSQPTPKFAKGGKINGKKHIQGGEIVEVEHDEWIINASASNKYNGLLKSINDGTLERKGITPELASKLLNSGMSSPIINLNNDNLAKELRAMPKNAISIDENGFKHYIVSENSKIQSLNKRYGV